MAQLMPPILLQSRGEAVGFPDVHDALIWKPEGLKEGDDVGRDSRFPSIGESGHSCDPCSYTCRINWRLWEQPSIAGRIVAEGDRVDTRFVRGRNVAPADGARDAEADALKQIHRRDWHAEILT